jgi:hypothetical protein
VCTNVKISINGDLVDDWMDNIRMGDVTAGSSNDGLISDYVIHCGSLGVLIVIFVKRVDGTGPFSDFNITIRTLFNYRIITAFELVQSRRNSATLMNRLEPVLRCFNYSPPCTLETIAANICTLLKNSGLMYNNIKPWGGMDLDSSIFYKNPNGMHLGILYHLTELNRWSMFGSSDSRCVFLENDDKRKFVSVEFLFDEKVLRYRFFEKGSDLLPDSLTGLQYTDLGTISSSDQDHILTGCLQTLRSKPNVRIPDGHLQWYIEGSDYMRFTGIKRIIDVYEPDNSEYTFFDYAGMPYYASYERNSVGPASADLAFSMIKYLSNLMDSSSTQYEKWLCIKKFMVMRIFICELPAEESSARFLRLCLFVPGLGNEEEKIQTISSFLWGNTDVSNIPVNISGDLKTIDSDHVNGILRESTLKWKFVRNSGNEWTIFIFIHRIRTASQRLADDDLSIFMNKDVDKEDRPPSLLSCMDSRNDQFTSTLRLLNRVLDTASTGL